MLSSGCRLFHQFKTSLFSPNYHPNSVYNVYKCLRFFRNVYKCVYKCLQFFLQMFTNVYECTGAQRSMGWQRRVKVWRILQLLLDQSPTLSRTTPTEKKTSTEKKTPTENFYKSYSPQLSVCS